MRYRILYSLIKHSDSVRSVPSGGRNIGWDDDDDNDNSVTNSHAKISIIKSKPQ